MWAMCSCLPSRLLHHRYVTSRCAGCGSHTDASDQMNEIPALPTNTVVVELVDGFYVEQKLGLALVRSEALCLCAFVRPRGCEEFRCCMLHITSRLHHCPASSCCQLEAEKVIKPVPSRRPLSQPYELDLLKRYDAMRASACGMC